MASAPPDPHPDSTTEPPEEHPDQVDPGKDEPGRPNVEAPTRDGGTK